MLHLLRRSKGDVVREGVSRVRFACFLARLGCSVRGLTISVTQAERLLWPRLDERCRLGIRGREEKTGGVG